jgi:hypothetical protein
MPRFTIIRNGHSLGQVDAFGDRIDLGSGSECQVVIDDAAIATIHARLVRSSTLQHYRIEPVSFEPATTATGITLSSPIEVADGAVFGVGEYVIRVDYLAGELVPLALPPVASPGESIEAPSAEPESVSPAETTTQSDLMSEVRTQPASPVNLFVPLADPPRSGTIPTWGWILAGAGIALLLGILLLIAL